MKTFRISQQETHFSVQAALADSFLPRLRGLMFRPSLRPDEGLFLKNCSSVHCCFMRFAIDVIYLDPSMRITGIETIRPWRLGHLFKGTRHVLEVNSGTAGTLRPGMILSVNEGGSI